MIFQNLIVCALISLISCVCDYNGTPFRTGDTWVIDSCNVCACEVSGAVNCQNNNCTAVMCHENGRNYGLGDTYRAADGCNECLCTVDGAICTKSSCWAFGAGTGNTYIPRCYYGGKVYTVGDAYPSTDGCNRCICTDRQISICSKKFCAPPTQTPPETPKPTQPPTTTPTETPKPTQPPTTSPAATDAPTTIAATTTKPSTTAAPTTQPSTTETQVKVTSAPTTTTPTCNYNGRVYNAGDSFKADDGCNTCRCSANGQVLCTKMACLTTTVGTQAVTTAAPVTKAATPAPTTATAAPSTTAAPPPPTTVTVQQTTPYQCDYNGQKYNYGMSFKATDGCNICICGKDSVVCSLTKCSVTPDTPVTARPTPAPVLGSSPATKCIYNGKDYSIGASFKADDGCNSCTCTGSGVAACTLMLCPPSTTTKVTPTGTSITCTYNGKVYSPGTSFPAMDGCNTCMCSQDRSVPCTKKLCPPTTMSGVSEQTTHVNHLKVTMNK